MPSWPGITLSYSMGRLQGRDIPAGCRPRATRFLRSAQDRLFCFGKRTQNHWRPETAFAVSVMPGLIGHPVS